MSYTTLKEKAFSHRTVLIAAIAGVLTITTAATALSFERKESNLRQIYRLSFHVTPTINSVTFLIEVTDLESGKIVWAPKIVSNPDAWATARTTRGAHDIELRVQGMRDGSATLLIFVKQAGELVQRNLYTFTPQAASAPPAKSEFTGEPISLDLKNADLKDVLNTFAAITGLDVAMSRDVEGKKVTISVKDVPWDEALDRIARENGLHVTVSGRVIHFSK
jgi:hypothetical protein